MNVRTAGILRKREGVTLLRTAAAAAAGFALSAGYAGGSPAMLNAALAAVFPAYAAPIFAASTLYYLLIGGMAAGVIQLSGILITAVLTAAFFHGTDRDSPIMSAALCTGVLLLLSFTVSAVTDSGGTAAAGRFIASVTAGAFVYSSQTLIHEYRLTKRLSLVGARGLLAGTVFVAVISALSSVTAVIFDLGRLIGCGVLLCMAKRFRMTGGAAVGALTALAVFIGKPAFAADTLLLASAGLICGAFAELGVLAISVSFIAVCAVGAATVSSGAGGWSLFFDAAGGALLFAALPSGLTAKAAALLFGGTSAADTVGRAAASRIGFVSSSLGEIRSQLALVSDAMDRKIKEQSLAEVVFDEMCRGCELRSVCHRDTAASAKRFAELEKAAMSYEGVSADTIRRYLRTCRTPELMSDSFNYAYKSRIDSRAARLRIGELRTLVSEQLAVMEEILSDLSGRIGRIRSVDKELSERAGEYLLRLGYRNARACLYLDEAGFRHAEFFIAGEFVGDRMELALQVSDIADCMFGLPVITRAEELTRIALSEAPAYELTRGTFSASSSDNGYSGDTFGMTEVSSCECYAILSDGMGTGRRAKLDSMFAVSRASRMLGAGVSMRSALKLINNILRVKGWDESFATLDIIRFDLCAGTAELLKAGAAPAYLCRDGVLKRFGGQAFPAGILDRCPPDEFSCKLFDGDLLLMVSDGVSEETVRAAFEQAGERDIDPAAFAQSLGEMAMEQAKNGRRDDISAAAFAVKYRGR